MSVLFVRYFFFFFIIILFSLYFTGYVLLCVLGLGSWCLTVLSTIFHFCFFLSDHDICALIYVSLLFYYHILNCYEVVFIFLFITCYRVPCSLFCAGMLMLFTYIPLYYMLQGTVQLILCWNVDVIYVYPSLLHVTGYHAAYSVLECSCYLRISLFITCYRIPCSLFCVGMLMVFTYVPLYYMLQGTMQLILC